MSIGGIKMENLHSDKAVMVCICTCTVIVSQVFNQKGVVSLQNGCGRIEYFISVAHHELY